MSKVIILPDETLDLFYERTLRYLHAKYHSYATNLERSPDCNSAALSQVSASDKSIQQSYSQYNIPLGKLIG